MRKIRTFSSLYGANYPFEVYENIEIFEFCEYFMLLKYEFCAKMFGGKVNGYKINY